MRIRPASPIFSVVALAALVALPECSAQTPPSRDQWGEKFNSPGAKLTYKEVGRTAIQSRTIITYNLFASGLPAVADAYLNGDGKVVNVLAGSERNIAEDPINVKVFGGKGEPIQLALISDDDRLLVFTEVIPFPIEETAGSCHLSAIETAPYYFGILIRGTGFQPDEELAIEEQSENESARLKAKADDQGRYNASLFPFVKGKKSGKARFVVSAKSCRIGIEFPWGAGSYHYQ
jgi:hypothetical protein